MVFAQLPIFPEAASDHADHVDALGYYILAVTGFFGVLIAVLLIVFSIRYRRSAHPKAVPIEGSTGLEIFWTVVPLLFALVMFVWGAISYFTIARPPEDTMEVYVVGRQWMWKA